MAWKTAIFTAIGPEMSGCSRLSKSSKSVSAICRTISLPFAAMPPAMDGHRVVSATPGDRKGDVATSKPPEPRPYKAATAEERVSRSPEPQRQPADVQTKPRSFLSRLWPFSPRKSIYPQSQDASRGLEAARRVVKEGFLDPRYKRASRSFTAVMCALPIAIYTSYELFQRRFMGKEQKARPVVSPMVESQDD